LDLFSLDGWGEYDYVFKRRFGLADDLAGSDVFIKLRCLLEDAGNAEI
jgi:hypothetical protein